MKDKIFTFIIGLLVGAIITAGVFLVINKNKSNDSNQENQTSTERQMPEGMQGGQRGNKGVRPGSTEDSNSEMPEDMGEPPALPDGEELDENNRPEQPQSTEASNEQVTE